MILYPYIQFSWKWKDSAGVGMLIIGEYVAREIKKEERSTNR